MRAQVRSLFPAYHNPFYAGFGNRDSDTRTYVSLKVSTPTPPPAGCRPPCVAPSWKLLRTPAYSCVLLRTPACFCGFYFDVLGRPSALVACGGGRVGAVGADLHREPVGRAHVLPARLVLRHAQGRHLPSPPPVVLGVRDRGSRRPALAHTRRGPRASLGRTYQYVRLGGRR